MLDLLPGPGQGRHELAIERTVRKLKKGIGSTGSRRSARTGGTADPGRGSRPRTQRAARPSGRRFTQITVGATASSTAQGGDHPGWVDRGCLGVLARTSRTSPAPRRRARAWSRFQPSEPPAGRASPPSRPVTPSCPGWPSCDSTPFTHRKLHRSGVAEQSFRRRFLREATMPATRRF